MVFVALLLGNLTVCQKITNDPQGCRGAKPDKCNGHCVKLQVDTHNCGTCGNVCGSGDVCTSGKCIGASTGKESTCNDGVKSGKETDIDCGGSTCPACADGKVCNIGKDCTSGVCPNGICQVPTCTDQVKNGDEKNIDCGRSCPPCSQQASLTKKPIINTSGINPLPGKVLSPSPQKTQPTSMGYSCEGLFCTCMGDEDCNDMFLHAGCGDVAQCNQAGNCSCLRVAF